MTSSDFTISFQLNNFHFKFAKFPISNAPELEAISNLTPVPPPEMLYGRNKLAVDINGKIAIEFSALKAFKAVSDKECHLKVAMAHKWTCKSQPNSETFEIIKPYDWTYTTSYQGDYFDMKFESNDTYKEIPLKLLKKQDPILFFDEIILYEGDNGTGMVTVKLRVMSTCFLILQRFFLRIDNVIIKIVDTRIYHEFGTDIILKEFLVAEIGYAEVKGRLPVNEVSEPDYTYVANEGWVSQLIMSYGDKFVKERSLSSAKIIG